MSPLLPVILTLSLTKGKNPVFSAEAPRYAQGDNLSHFAIVLTQLGAGCKPALSS